MKIDLAYIQGIKNILFFIGTFTGSLILPWLFWFTFLWQYLPDGFIFGLMDLAAFLMSVGCTFWTGLYFAKRNGVTTFDALISTFRNV